MSSSSSSPCAACKFLRRKCTPGCIFAPYFPPDNQKKFICVHRVFGASNVAKILNDINPAQREDAVNSLAWEAECRLNQPVYGCVSYISMLQEELRRVQQDLQTARAELFSYIGPAAYGSFIGGELAQMQHLHHQQAVATAAAPAVSPGSIPMPVAVPTGAGPGISTVPGDAMASQLLLMKEQQQRQQTADELQTEMQASAWAETADREQEQLRRYQQQQLHLQRQHLNELLRLNSGLDGHGAGPSFNQHQNGLPAAVPVAVPVAPSNSAGLAFVPIPAEALENSFRVTQQQNYNADEESLQQHYQGQEHLQQQRPPAQRHYRERELLQPSEQKQLQEQQRHRADQHNYQEQDLLIHRQQ